MEWKQKFEVGNEKIDFEHRIFFDLISSMDKESATSAGTDRIRRIMAEIEKYAEFHFLSEENLMVDIGYPRLAEHHRIHEELLARLRELIIEFENGTNSSDELSQFLLSWFAEHTTTEDLLLSQYIDSEENNSD